MTEIKAGTSFTASSRLMQEMHTSAQDGKVEAKELARLVQIASDDSAGLTEDDKALLQSLYAGKIDTSGLTPEEQALVSRLQNSDASKETVQQNIQSLQNVVSHENDASTLDFSKLQLVTESRSLLSKASFGLFGGKEKLSHVVRISDGNIPTVSNPQTTSSATDRRETDRENLVKMLGPLEQELQDGLAPNSDIRQRFAQISGKDPNSPEVTLKVETLLNKIKNFKEDPSKADWTTSSDLTELMNSYATNPPVNNPRINAGYMSSLLGTFWNATKSSEMASEQQQNFQNGTLQTPSSIEGINNALSSSNIAARQDLEANLAKTSAFINQLDALKESDPALYQQLLRGTDESGIDTLRAQVSELKQQLSTGGPVTQAQLNQLTTARASLFQIEKGLNFSPAAGNEGNNAQLTALREQLNHPDTPEDQKAGIQQQISELEAQSALPAESQAKLDAIKGALNEARYAGYDTSETTKGSAATRSGMIYELEQAESTLARLLPQHGLTDAQRTQLQGQLDATRAAISQLKSGQEVKLESPEQEAAFNKVLQNLQQLKPAPAPVSQPSVQTPVAGPQTSPAAVTPSGTPPDLTIPSFNLGGTGTILDPTNRFSALPGGDFNLAPVITQPDPLNFGASLTSPLLTSPSLLSSPALYGPSLNYPGLGSSSSLFGNNSLLYGSSSATDPFGLYSPSLSYGGYGGGLGGFNYGLPTLAFPAIPAISTPLTATPAPSAETAPAQAPASLSNIFLDGVGANPDDVTPLSPAMQERQTQALETIAKIEADPNASPEAKAAAMVMKQLVENPNQAIKLPTGKTFTPPHGSFEASISVLETYKQLTDQGISPADAEVAFMLAAQGVQNGQSPAAIAEQVQSIAQSGSTDEIKNKLQTYRKENIVSAQANMSELATGLKSSEMMTQLAGKVLGDDFLNQVKQLPGGENVSNVDEALKFLKDSKQDTQPSYLTQIIQSPNFQAEQQKLLDDSSKNYADLNTRSAQLVDQVKASGLKGAQNVRTVDDAILFLVDSRSAEHTELLQQLRDIKQESDSFAPQLAGIRQLAAVSQNYNTMMTEMGDAISALEALPDTPENQAQIATLTAVRNELAQNGQLKPESARLYADFRVGRQLNTFEAAVGSDPDQTVQGRQFLRDAMEGFHAAGTPEEKNTAFSNILSGLESGTLRSPRRMERQNEYLRALGLPETDRALSPAEFLSRLRQYQPSAVIQQVVEEQADIAVANDIARSNLTGSPPLEEIAARREQYVTQGTTMRTDPASVASMAADNPVAAAFQSYTQAAADTRERIASLPPDQQASAWGGVLNERNAANQILNQMDTAISASIADLSLANNDVMVASGYPPVSGNARQLPESPGDARARELSAAANSEAANRDLAPMPEVSGNELFSKWLSETLHIIRNWDENERKAFMSQLALKMVDDVIQTFYKNASDRSHKHHEEAIASSKAQAQELATRVESTRQAENAGNNAQAVAAQSGSMNVADRSAAFSRNSSITPDQAREQMRSMIQQARNGSPPLQITALQEQQLLDKFELLIQAAATSGISDDRLAVAGLRGQLSGF